MREYNIMFASHPDYSGNAKALYEYIEKKYKNMNLCWTIYDENNSKYFEKNKISHVVHDTNEYKKKMRKTDIVFFTHDELIEDKIDGQIFIYLGHGNGSKKFGRMIDKSKLAKGDEKYLYMMKKSIDYIICSTELYRVLYCAMLGVDYDRILPLGTARTDYIHSNDAKEKLNKVIKKDTSKFDKILMYLPTFRNGLGRDNDGAFSENVLNIEEYNEKELNDYLIKNNYLLIIKYHPYETKKDIKIDSDNIIYIEEENLTKNLISLAEIIGAVDLVIADYSSAYSDFVILDRPVCFLQNDLKEYRESREIIFDDINIWCPGPSIKNIKELKREFNKLLNDKTYYSEERKSYTKLVFGENTKNVCKNVCETLFNSDFKLTPKSQKLNSDVERKINLLTGDLKEENDKLIEENKRIKNELEKKNEELDKIYHSKGWKILERARHLIRR